MRCTRREFCAGAGALTLAACAGQTPLSGVDITVDAGGTTGGGTSGGGTSGGGTTNGGTTNGGTTNGGTTNGGTTNGGTTNGGTTNGGTTTGGTTSGGTTNGGTTNCGTTNGGTTNGGTTTGGTTTGSTTGGGTTGGGACAGTVNGGAASAITVGHPKRVVSGGADVFVCRDANGLYALDNFCTHAGCALSAQTGGTFFCACHGATFDATGGSPTSPAVTPLDHFAVCVNGSGEVIVDPTQTVDPSVRV